MDSLQPQFNLHALLINRFQKTAALLAIDFEARADYFVTFFLVKDFGLHGKGFNREPREIHEPKRKKEV
jgi:hypothetical protein